MLEQPTADRHDFNVGMLNPRHSDRRTMRDDSGAQIHVQTYPHRDCSASRGEWGSGEEYAYEALNFADGRHSARVTDIPGRPASDAEPSAFSSPGAKGINPNFDLLLPKPAVRTAATGRPPGGACLLAPGEPHRKATAETLVSVHGSQFPQAMAARILWPVSMR